MALSLSLNKRNLFLVILKAGKSKIKVLADLAPGYNPLAGFQIGFLLLYPHMAEKDHLLHVSTILSFLAPDPGEVNPCQQFMSYRVSKSTTKNCYDQSLKNSNQEMQPDSPNWQWKPKLKSLKEEKCHECDKGLSRTNKWGRGRHAEQGHNRVGKQKQLSLVYMGQVEKDSNDPCSLYFSMSF